MAATGCAGASHVAPRVLPSSGPSSLAAPPSVVASAPVSSPPSPPPVGSPIASQAFGMYYLGFGAHSYPSMGFGSARIWDMGVTWKDVQPTANSSLTGRGSVALQRLDAIIATFRSHHVEPLLTLCMTPSWAARACKHVVRGIDWGPKTCAPRDVTGSGPWGRYVRAMALRYRHSVRYFELWNEPSLRNGWNDTLPKLAQMQAVAHRILASLGFGQKLVAPSIAFTDGAPRHGLRWLNTFLSLPGGTEF